MRKAVIMIFIGVMLSPIFGNVLKGQSAAAFGQQVAVAKKLRPDLTILGIISSTATDKSIEQMTRAGLAQSVKIVVARLKTPPEVPELYKALVSDKKVQMLILPDPADDMMTGMGFEYLREAALGDKVGLIVPLESLVSTGGLCFITNQGGTLKTVINYKVASMLGIIPPSDGSLAFTYVGK